MQRLRASAFVLTLLGPLFARGQTTAPKDFPPIHVADCEPALASQLPNVIKLEIDVLLRERGPTRSLPDVIAVRCETENAQIDVTMGGARRTLTIDLHALTVEHRARAVGLAAAELVHAMSSEPRASETPENVGTAPVTPRQDDRLALDLDAGGHDQKSALFAGAFAEWRGDPSAFLLGGRIAFQSRLGKVFVPELSADASFGGISTTLARVSIQSYSAAAYVYFRATTGVVRWDIGPGARVGVVHLVGSPVDGAHVEGDSLTAAWGGPEVRVRVSYGASALRPALVALQLGAGMVALPVRGLRDGNEAIYSVEGAWASLGAEVGLGL
jgi:hypothetical protein